MDYVEYYEIHWREARTHSVRTPVESGVIKMNNCDERDANAQLKRMEHKMDGRGYVYADLVLFRVGNLRMSSFSRADDHDGS